MNQALTVKLGGLSTTVQDLGRLGFQSLGIPTAGALDPLSLRLANALVRNHQGVGALEIRVLGPTLQVDADAVRIALVGTGAPIEVLEPDRRVVPSGRSVTLVRGTVFRVGAVSDSGCCYLAIAGGFACAEVFGSQSTYVRGGIGGFEGRPLRDGDVVPLHGTAPPSGGEQQLSEIPRPPSRRAIRVVLGPQADYFSRAGVETFLAGTYRVSRETDRMGMRLDGPTIEHAKGYNIPSDGIVTGAIQVPGNGLPIVLLADRQTTGGYPKIACVVSADLPHLGRLVPGAEIRFTAVSSEEAETLRRRQQQDIKEAVSSIRPLADEAASLEQALHRESLISGWEWIVEEKWYAELGPHPTNNDPT